VETDEEREKRAQRLARFGAPPESSSADKESGKPRRSALEMTLDDYKLKGAKSGGKKSMGFDKNKFNKQNKFKNKSKKFHKGRFNHKKRFFKNKSKS